MKQYWSSLLIFSLFFMYSCDNKKAQSDYQNASLDEAFELKINKTVSLDGSKLLVQFKDVPEDSRCPEGVNCMWAGKVSVALELTQGGETQSINLTKEGKSKKSVSATAGAYKISLEAVNPYPKDGVQRQKEDYVVTLMVTKV